MRPLPFLPLLLASALCGCEGSPSSSQDKGENQPAEPAPIKLEGEYVPFPAVGVKLRMPPGYEIEKAFYGFGDAETRSSVIAASMPASFEKTTAGYTTEKMKAAGMTLLGKENLEVLGQNAVLIHMFQIVKGTEFEKWLLAFGDEEQTILLTAAFPSDYGKRLSGQMKAILLDVKKDETPPPAP